MFIVEYHRISRKEARWDRSIAAFRRDLGRLYGLGFRPVTLTSYLDGKMDLPPGASPVVFTFDDSDLSQFRLLADGTVDPDCAVGVWSDFAKTHPDFPVRATFYVLPDAMWGRRSDLAAKLKMLKEWGCELGSHTMSHTSLRNLSDEQVESEIGRSMDAIRRWGFEPNSIALPYGIAPRNASLLRGFHRGGREYRLRAALLVGAGPAPAAGNVYRLPRIQGIDGPYGLTYWLDRVREGKAQPYVAP